MNKKISVYKVNESFLRLVVREEQIFIELSRYFKKKVPNYKFMPMYKKKFWDGSVSFYKNGKIPYGLLDDLKEFVKKGGYELELKFDDKPNQIDEQELKDFIEFLNLPYKLDEHQYTAILTSLKEKRLINVLPTSAGKSIIMYVIMRYLLDVLNIQKVLIIVPLVSLVNQLYDNFIEYGYKDIDKYVVKSTDYKVMDTSKVLISTWQSLQNKKIDYFKNFKIIMIDEAHGVKSKGSNYNVITNIIGKCVNASYRFGFTGTMPDEKTMADYFTLKGYIGKDISFVDYQTLIKAGRISDLDIKIIILDYNNSLKEKYWNNVKEIKRKKKDYKFQDDSEFLININEKYQVIIKLLEKLDKKNSIVLFTRKAQGKRLKEIAKEYFKDKTILYIDGDVDVDERDKFKKIIEEQDNVILFASYGTFSQGINLKNVHYIVFASAYKSKIKTLQSIGRGLRQYPDKKLTVIDIVDNFSTTIRGKFVKNFSVKHLEKRLQIYKKNEFKYIIYHKEV